MLLEEKNAEVCVQLPTRTAWITLRDRVDVIEEYAELNDAETALVHELLHIYTEPLSLPEKVSAPRRRGAVARSGEPCPGGARPPSGKGARGPVTFIPRASLIHVKLSKPAEKSRGGIFIPETALRLTTEARVLGTGRGHYIAALDIWETVRLLEGDLVLFPQHAFRGLEGDFGLIEDDDVVATVDPRDNSLTPEADWVLCDPDEPEEITRGGIALPDQALRLPRSGIVKKLGPGLLRYRGPYAGLRMPIWRALNLEDATELTGKRAYFAATAEVMRAAGQALVRGRDIIALEER